jgi:hypothetical protein
VKAGGARAAGWGLVLGGWGNWNGAGREIRMGFWWRELVG